MKISIIGAGNVGGTSAMRLAQENLGEIVLIDVFGGLAQGKAYDLDDARSVLKIDYNIKGSNDISEISGSNVIVVTAGLARKPGMTREDLANKNAAILKDVCSSIKKLAKDAVVIIVTNPLDLMTYHAIKMLGFSQTKVFGMGASLDSSRFSNLIAEELKINPSLVDALVMGIHGEGMLPIPRFSTIRGVSLEELLSEDRIKSLTEKTVQRGAQIVSLLGSGSAFYAPSAAIAALVKAIVKDEKRNIPVSSYLNGEYGIKDACLGVLARIGSSGIEKIIELDLKPQEKEILVNSANGLRNQYSNIK